MRGTHLRLCPAGRGSPAGSRAGRCWRSSHTARPAAEWWRGPREKRRKHTCQSGHVVCLLSTAERARTVPGRTEESVLLTHRERDNGQNQDRSLGNGRERPSGCRTVCLTGAENQRGPHPSKNAFQQRNGCSKLLAMCITFMQILSV